MRKNLHISKNCITFAPKLKNKTGRQPETAAKKIMKTYELRNKKTGLFSGTSFYSIREAIDFINYAHQDDKNDWQILRLKEDGTYSQVIYK